MSFSVTAHDREGNRPPCVIISGLTPEQKSHLMVVLSTRAPRQTTPAGATRDVVEESQSRVRVNFKEFTGADTMVGLIVAFLLQEGINTLGGRN